MQMIDVDRATFEKLDPTRRIINADYARRFAIIRLNSFGEYGLAWRSELIEPSITRSNSMLWIGIDENLVALSLEQGIVSVALTLFYPLFSIHVAK
jgi:hypothetical protein